MKSVRTDFQTICTNVNSSSSLLGQRCAVLFWIRVRMLQNLHLGTVPFSEQLCVYIFPMEKHLIFRFRYFTTLFSLLYVACISAASGQSLDTEITELRGG